MMMSLHDNPVAIPDPFLEDPLRILFCALGEPLKMGA
jgi:hypothetical protein